MERLKKFDFREKGAANLIWTDEMLKDFLSKNSSMSDHELAKYFQTTLPAINHIRRKIKLSERILTATKKKVSVKSIIPLIKRAEKGLKAELLELEKIIGMVIANILEKKIGHFGSG